MSTDVLGSLSFDSTPDVSGSSTIIKDGTVPSFSAGTTAARPTAGQTGRVYIDTTVSKLFRDNGSTWDSLAGLIVLDAVTSQTSIVQATTSSNAIIGIASDLIMPGTGAFQPPQGTTAQRPATPVTGMCRWNTSLGAYEVYNGAVWTPEGRVLQVVTGNIAAQTATNSQTPLDATAPLSTEGSQVWTASFTPVSAASKIIISYSMTHVHGTATRTQIQALFAGTTNIGSMATTCAVAASQYPSCHQVVYSPGSTATITFSCRVGSSGNGTWYVNSGATNTLGGTMVSQYTITEVL